MTRDFFVVFYWIGIWSLFELSGLLKKWQFCLICLLIGITGKLTVYFYGKNDLLRKPDRTVAAPL